MVFLGGAAVSYEQGTPVQPFETLAAVRAALRGLSREPRGDYLPLSLSHTHTLSRARALSRFARTHQAHACTTDGDLYYNQHGRHV